MVFASINNIDSSQFSVASAKFDLPEYVEGIPLARARVARQAPPTTVAPTTTAATTAADTTTAGTTAAGQTTAAGETTAAGGTTTAGETTAAPDATTPTTSDEKTCQAGTGGGLCKDCSTLLVITGILY